MGKVRSSKVKRLALELLEKYSSALSTDFEKNKEVAKQYLPHVTKRMRNRVAGYVTRLTSIKARSEEAAAALEAPTTEGQAKEGPPQNEQPGPSS